MKVCLARLRNTLRYRAPLHDIVDSFAELLRGYIAARPEIEFSFFRMSLDGSKPPADPDAIASADVVAVISEAEFAWQTKGLKNQMHVDESNRKLAEIAPLMRGKPLLLLRSDRADTPELYRERTFRGCELGPIGVLDETDLPPLIHGMKYWFIRDSRMWRDGPRDRDFCYWGAANKAKLPSGEPSGDERREVLRAVHKRLGMRAFFIGAFPFKDAPFTRDFESIIVHGCASRYTLCFNWLDQAALTSRYFEALGCGMVPLAWKDYDARGICVRDWQRVRSTDELLDKIADLDFEKARWEAQRDLLATLPRPAQFLEMFSRAMDARIAELGEKPMTENAAPAWAKGFDLEFLKAAAAVFKASMKPHTYGAFGLPKERDIADAMADNALVWTMKKDSTTKEIAAVAIAKVLSRPSPHHDFAGRTATINAGDVFVKAIAGEPEAIERLIAGVTLRAEPPAMWIEAHVEDRALVESLEARGFERVMTKISASSDLKGLYCRGGEPSQRPAPLEPADEPSVAVLSEEFISPEECAAILAEAEAAAQWAQHYSGYNKRQSWTAFALHGFDPSDPSFIIKPAEMSKKWKEDNADRMLAECGPTVAAQHFPTALAVAERVPGAKERVRLMRLSAKGGELTRHADITDPDAGTRDGQLSRLHIPLQSHEQCVFRTWDLEGREHRTHFAERSLCYLDTRKPHAVINPDDVDRIHLVLDTFATPELREALAENKKRGRPIRAAPKSGA